MAKKSKQESIPGYLWNNMKASIRGGRAVLLMTQVEVVAMSCMDCAYCGAAPERGHAVLDYAKNGIDRIDNQGPYQVGNVLPCCRKCNWAKGQESVESFLAWIARLKQQPPLDVQKAVSDLAATLADIPKWTAYMDSLRKPASAPRSVVDGQGGTFRTCADASKAHPQFSAYAIGLMAEGKKTQPDGFKFEFVHLPANDNARIGYGYTPKPVKDDLGNVFASISAAAKHYHADVKTVKKAVDHPTRRCRGRLFTSVSEAIGPEMEPSVYR